MYTFIFAIIIIVVIFGIILTQTQTNFLFAAKPNPRQGSVPGIPGLTMDTVTCPNNYVFDMLSKKCVLKSSVPQPGPGNKPSGLGVKPGGPSPMPCKGKIVKGKCVTGSGSGSGSGSTSCNGTMVAGKCVPCKGTMVKGKCVTSGGSGPCKGTIVKGKCVPCNGKMVKGKCVTSDSGPGQKQCPGKQQISQNGKCVDLCISNNRPGVMNNGSCQAFNTSSSGFNNPALNQPLVSNCGQGQFQDKSGKCLNLCVTNNKPGVIRDGQCRNFSNSMLGSGSNQGGNQGGSNQGGSNQGGSNQGGSVQGNKPISCPPGQIPSPTNSRVCVIDTNYNPSLGITCPPGQVFENGSCKVPLQGPPPQQKPVAIPVGNIPNKDCPQGQTCSGTVNFQGHTLPSYTYNGQTYIIKNVNGKPQPCAYMPNMNSNGEFPCLDSYDVNFVNGQIVPITLDNKL